MITAPGAPLSGLAPPLSTPPSPSPNHHTPSDQRTEAARGARTVGRNAMPSPSSSWIVAKTALNSTRWWSIRVASQVIGFAMTAGLPSAVPASIWLKPLVNMNPWYCSTPSSSQMAARTSCSARLASTDGLAATGSVPSLPRHAVRLPATATSVIGTPSRYPADTGGGRTANGNVKMNDRRVFAEDATLSGLLGESSRGDGARQPELTRACRQSVQKPTEGVAR